MVESPYPIADLQEAMREASQEVLTTCAANLTLLAGGIGARGGRRVSKSPASFDDRQA